MLTEILRERVSKLKIKRAFPAWVVLMLIALLELFDLTHDAETIQWLWDSGPKWWRTIAEYLVKIPASTALWMFVAALIWLAALAFWPSAKKSKSDYDEALSLRNKLQSFIDDLGPEPQSDYRLGHDEFNRSLEAMGQYERKLTHGFQLRLALPIQTFIHKLGEKNIEEADLTFGMQYPPKNLATLTQIRNGLSALVSDLKPKN